MSTRGGHAQRRRQFWGGRVPPKSNPAAPSSEQDETSHRARATRPGEAWRKETHVGGRELAAPSGSLRPDWLGGKRGGRRDSSNGPRWGVGKTPHTPQKRIITDGCAVCAQQSGLSCSPVGMHAYLGIAFAKRFSSRVGAKLRLSAADPPPWFVF
uniref:Uncharacterized protein n=1 Tax=Sphaerodactylus townsendi TaxID=933632 RepID=A0ACB8E924_9SAUR